MKSIWRWFEKIVSKNNLSNIRDENLTLFDIDNFQSGNWLISYYFDNYNDETLKFSGYSFSFYSNGDFIAVKGNIISNGTWVFNEVLKRLQIIINSGDPLIYLEDEWTFTHQSENTLILGDDKLQSNEQLHLKKIIC